MTEPHEIEPFIVFRRDERSADVALWKLTDGRQAIALFLDQASAEAYRQTADLGAIWEVYQPDRLALVAILREALAGGVQLVVLQPTNESAQRLWSIDEVLKNA